MHKLLDNTFLSAAEREIRAADVLAKVMTRYVTVITAEVAEEASAGNNKLIVSVSQ